MEIVSWGMNAIKEAVKNYLADLSAKEVPPHTGQVGDHTTCSQNKHVGEFLYFKLPKLPVQVKSRPIKDVTKYVLNTDVQFTN